MEKTEEAVAGTTRYVKVGNTIQDRFEKDNTPTKVICECLFCGERFGGNMAGKCAMYCSNCKTAEGRKKITEANK